MQLTDIPQIELNKNKWNLIKSSLFTSKNPSIDNLLQILNKSDYSQHKYAWISFCNVISKQYHKIKKQISEIDIEKLDKSGSFDFYLRGNMNIKLEFPINYAILYVLDDPMMSITPMEIQSHINPYLWSHGNVLIAGLGLGFIANQIVKKDSVKSVDVIELEQEIIDIYYETFPLNSKLKIIKSNIFEFESKKPYDYVYLDIWDKFSFERMLKSTEDLIARKNKGLLNFTNISFWTVEDAIWNDIFEGNFHFKDYLKKYHIEFGETEILNLYRLLRGI